MGLRLRPNDLRRIFEVGTSPEPVFWVVVEGWLGGESPFLNHAQKTGWTGRGKRDTRGFRWSGWTRRTKCP